MSDFKAYIGGFLIWGIPNIGKGLKSRLWGKFGRYISGNGIKGMSGSGQTAGKEHKERMAKRTLDGVERSTLDTSFPNTFGGDWLPPRVAEGKESLGKPSGLPFSKGIEDKEQGVALADPQAVLLTHRGRL